MRRPSLVAVRIQRRLEQRSWLPCHLCHQPIAPGTMHDHLRRTHGQPEVGVNITVDVGVTESRVKKERTPRGMSGEDPAPRTPLGGGMSGKIVGDGPGSEKGLAKPADGDYGNVTLPRLKE